MSTRAPLSGKDIRKQEEGNVAPETALYRSLVRLLLPAHFRERHGEELVWVFSELLTDARFRKGARGRATIWLREVPALLQLTWRVRRRGYDMAWGTRPNGASREGADGPPGFTSHSFREGSGEADRDDQGPIHRLWERRE